MLESIHLQTFPDLLQSSSLLGYLVQRLAEFEQLDSAKGLLTQRAAKWSSISGSCSGLVSSAVVRKPRDIWSGLLPTVLTLGLRPRAIVVTSDEFCRKSFF